MRAPGILSLHATTFTNAMHYAFQHCRNEETRQLIRSKADESKDYLRRRSEELRGSANELVDRGKTTVTRQREHLAAAVEAGRQAYREAVTTNRGELDPQI